MRLYADAVRLTLDLARFRELWRVLESALAETGKQLVDLLAAYPPAQQLEFGHGELSGLLTLRGRASHAQTKGGVQQLAAVERECRQRLQNLVERVILTKQHWGHPTPGVAELTPLQAYIDREGYLVIL